MPSLTSDEARPMYSSEPHNVPPRQPTVHPYTEPLERRILYLDVEEEFLVKQIKQMRARLVEIGKESDRLKGARRRNSSEIDAEMTDLIIPSEDVQQAQDPNVLVQDTQYDSDADLPMNPPSRRSSRVVETQFDAEASQAPPIKTEHFTSEFSIPAGPPSEAPSISQATRANLPSLNFKDETQG